MQQREKEKRKRKKRNINPKRKQKHVPLPHHQMKDAHICAKNRSTRGVVHPYVDQKVMP
jgi:hypothetical protein